MSNVSYFPSFFLPHPVGDIMNEIVNVYLGKSRIFLATFDKAGFDNLSMRLLITLAKRLSHQAEGKELLFTFEFVEAI